MVLSLSWLYRPLAMRQERWLNYIMNVKYTSESRPITELNRLLKECHGRGITAERVFGEKEILLEAATAVGMK